MEKTSRDTAPVVDSKVSVERSYSQKSVEKTEMMRYDDEVKEILINPNCLTRILLDYVCEQLTIDKEGVKFNHMMIKVYIPRPFQLKSISVMNMEGWLKLTI